ncbi:MAG TPA: hypothetical protein DCM28_23395 [Phycisphaerales bacterium]|nr:hypothetical protein [Phycisphaerales bacterium]HCD34024.1 hypothetical protein [Phycisphaerales bacterium]|tara:strand:+ start:1354 stop:1566 length:213 start_codon:yes stop_codon:yes gene_type:complete
MPSNKSIRKQKHKTYLDTLPTTTMQELIDCGKYPADYMFMNAEEISRWQMSQIKTQRKIENKYDFEITDE